MPDKEKKNVNTKNLNSLSKYIHKQLISEFKLNNIDLLVDVAAGKVKKVILKRPLSKNGAVNDFIDMYLDYYNVKVTKKY